ncbi:MAG: DUF3108 domain-containing protein [Bacteroidota bacterium]|nr:DUF3108 domain-containing protein [Bacteroidota bacterium]
MKKLVLQLFLAFFANSLFADGDELRSMQNHAFQRGELLEYRVFYDSWVTSWLTAGTGSVHVTDDKVKFHDRDTYHMVIEGRSHGLFNWFFKVRDRFESYVDEEALVPWKFVRRTREGDFVKDDDVSFDQFKHTAKSRTHERSIPPNTQDIVSAFYVMRNLNIDSLEVNDELKVQFLLDDSVYTSRIIFLGREEVKLKAGKFRALAFKPKMAKGEVFDKEYPMTIWVSDDKNHIPLKLQSEVIIGSITIELTNYEKLKHPLNSRID